MSTKFWNLVLEADIDNINQFAGEIEENKHQEGSLTLKYLADKHLRNEFGVITDQLDHGSYLNKDMILKTDERPIVVFKQELRNDLDILNDQIMEEYE